MDFLLGLSAVPTAVLSRDGEILDVNTFGAWSGRGAGQLVGLRIHDLLDPSEHAGFDYDLDRLGRPGSADRRARAERAVVSAAGRRIWAIVDLVVVPSATGPPALVSQWTDVTELRDHEELERPLNAVLDAVAVLRSVRDEAGAIVDFEWVHLNDAGCRMTGRPREQIVGQRLLAGDPTYRDTSLFAEFRKVAESGRTLTRSGLRIDSSWLGGRSVPRRFDLRAARLGDGFVLAWRDVTEQLEHVAALERHARHNEVLAAVSAAFSQAGSDLNGVVAALVRQLVAHLADFAGVALLSSDATRLDSAIAFAAGSAGALPVKGLATKPIPLAADGPHQRAFHSGQSVVRNQLDDDGRWP